LPEKILTKSVSNLPVLIALASIPSGVMPVVQALSPLDLRELEQKIPPPRKATCPYTPLE